MLDPRERGLECVLVGGTCSDCGFSYSAYRGHLEPCPRCALARMRVALEDAIAHAVAGGASATVRILRRVLDIR